MITQELVKEHFTYEDGNLIRNFNHNNQKSGDIAGWITVASRDKKYKRISFLNTHKYVHQIIFLYHHGFIPKYIDHINGNSLDNRIENLREATQSLNNANSKLAKSNTSGIKGVTWRKDTKKWAAQIMKDKKNYSLGSFQNIEDAATAYRIAAEKLFGEFARPEKREELNLPSCAI